MTLMVDQNAATGRAHPQPVDYDVDELARLVDALRRHGYETQPDPAATEQMTSACPLCSVDGPAGQLSIFAASTPGYRGSVAFVCDEHPMFAIGASLGIRTKLMDAIELGRQELNTVIRALETKNLTWQRYPDLAAAYEDSALQAQCPRCIKERAREQNLMLTVNADTETYNQQFGFLIAECQEGHGDLSRELGVTTRQTLRATYGALNWSESAEHAEQWVIEPLVERGQFVSLYGPAGIGKSLLMQEHAFRLAEQGARVLYLDHENPPAEIRNRRQAMGHATAPPATLVYLSFPPVSALDTAAGAAELHQLAENLRPDVIVLDTWSKFLAGDEAAPSTHTEAYNLAIVPLRRDGITVVALDHSGKELGRGPRGGSSKVDNVDVLWMMTIKSNGRLRLERQKSRTGRGPDLVELTRQAGPLRHDRAQQQAADILTPDVRACVAKLDELEVPPGWGRDRAAEVLRANDYRIRNEALAQALKVRKERGNAPVDTLDLSPIAGDSRGQVEK